MQLIRQLMDDSLRLKAILLTPEERSARLAVDDDARERILIRSVSMEDVNSYLNAADYGLLLRKTDAINHVASPLKFAEYSLAGLPIIMTNAVEQAVHYSRLLGNAIPFAFTARLHLPPPFSDSRRCVVSQKAKCLLDRQAFISQYLRLYDK
jgi:hypothetical protein